jgi:hypothetical protein
MVDDLDSDSDPRDAAAPKPSAGAGGRFWRLAQPLLEQSVLNLRVWLPILGTPDMKGRQVKYRARESRTGLKWHVSLPEQCWQCGTTEALAQREFKRSIRRFDSPLSIIFGTLGLAGMLLLPWLIFGSWKFVGLAIVVIIGGGVLLGIKSWNERVRVTVWTCSPHAEELSAPSMASGEDDLYVFVATEALAEAARAELQAARRRDILGGPASTTKTSPAKATHSAARERAGNEAPAADASPLPPRPISVRTELPPLKLAGDDEPDA